MTTWSLETLSTPESLAEVLRGRDEREVDDLLSELGVQPALDKVFRVMCERTLATRVGNARAVVRWELATPKGQHVTQLEFASGRCAISQDRVAVRPDVVLGATTSVFLRIVAGIQSGLDAYARGMLRVTGDLELALKHQGWFDIDLSHAELSIATPSQLSRLVDGRSDAEIEAGVMLAGVDRALDQVFDGMVKHYVPQRGPRKRTVVEFHVHTPSGDRTYQLAADRGLASYRRGDGESASVRLGMSLPDLLRLAAGTLDPIRSLANRRLKLRGNPLTAHAIPGWFDRSR